MTFDERLTAVHVIQRFVRMSRTLIPLFYELRKTALPSPTDEEDIHRIRLIYDNFKADPSVSLSLINSDIIHLIKEVYSKLLHDPLNKDNSTYNEFIRESDRLIDQWNRIEMN
ncbi:MAG: hypothetical protein MI810_18510 [Flavobacteriales bacterium]|nr:hypothetical protein [Flavobacteriales bacterium]